ncbi:MAG: branched-chain amino acid ABC transporter permease [Chloroflexota bacterium]
MDKSAAGTNTRALERKQGWGRLVGVGYVNALIIAVLLVFPWVMNSYHTGLMAKVLVYGILALSLDFMWGYAGILSFGHSALFALGAYGLGLTLKYVDWPGATYLGFIVGIIGPGVFAALLGYFLFYGRISGVYFGIITLALAAALQQAFISAGSITGGDNGLYGFPAPSFTLPGLPTITLDADMPVFYAALVGAIVAYVVTRSLANSPFGRALKGVKSSDVRMEALGYDVAKLKMVTFGICGALAGFAGTLYVPVSFVSPALFALTLSTSVIIWVAVGGRGTLIGAFVGALVLVYLEAILSESLVTLWLLLVGIFLILVVVFWPQGIMGFIRERFGRTFIG